MTPTLRAKAIDLKALREACLAATPGVWFFDSYSKVFSHPVEDDDDPVFQSGKILAGDTATKQGAADCQFVCLASPSTVLALCRIAECAKEYWNKYAVEDCSVADIHSAEDALEAALAELEVKRGG